MAPGVFGTLIPDLIIPRPMQAFSWKLMKIQEKILVKAFLAEKDFGNAALNIRNNDS